MRGQTLCRAHLTAAERWAGRAAPERSAPVDAPPRRRRPRFEQQIEEVVARFASEAGLEHESLSEEISALRIVLARLLAEEDDPSRLASSIPRIVDAVVRAVRAERSISGVLAEGLTQAVTQVLIELGLDQQR
jgi:hypothetical protein